MTDAQFVYLVHAIDVMFFVVTLGVVVVVLQLFFVIDRLYEMNASVTELAREEDEAEEGDLE